MDTTNRELLFSPQMGPVLLKSHIMGYSEIYCHICGVSFNINRGRTDEEPRSAAWGDRCDFVSGFARGNCPDKGGCFFVQRDLNGDQSTLASSELNKKCIPLIESDDSSDDSQGNISDVSSANSDFDWDYIPEDWEHIASPECGQSSAYNGHHISVEAMRGCTTLQCLVRKSENWKPAPDDEQFEIQGHFFLSGLSDHMPSRDICEPVVFPERHSEKYPRAENCLWGPEGAETYAMPFHPTCLEVFKRASLYRYGVVDLECLTQWWVLELTYDDFHAFPRYEGVSNAQEQYWQHNLGDEFLAANPCFVPGLEPLLSSTQQHEHIHSEFIPTGVVSGTVPADLFSLLPGEIRLMILTQLSFKDIAKLRLASRTFMQLPTSLFYQLTMRDTPWLYEAWSSLPLSFWATTTQSEEERKQELVDIRVKELRQAIQSPEMVNAQGTIDSLKKDIDELLERNRTPRPTTSVTLLSRTDTDWYALQTLITRNWKTLPGLKNRRRIWDDCQEILNRVDAYRKEGKICPGEAVDLAEVGRQYDQRKRRSRAGGQVLNAY
ncbi:hypothetical protein F53441_4773 [Fusarium austroafricanum]|uniref:F-box domain-containing protein n=1 Tax=Fusarium austroafricanum TaxID=2364996 RepID=A0A8H4KN62_9HYPO|nr:hypothetical protein F53441_4773 [Fusarium austroafricanum]